MKSTIHLFILALSLAIVSCDDPKTDTHLSNGETTTQSGQETVADSLSQEAAESETQATVNPNRPARELKREPADLVTRFQYAYFEKRFDDFHSLLSRKDKQAKTLATLESEFLDMTKAEDIMTTYILSSSDYQADSTYTIAPDSIVVFGKSTAPLFENVQREVSVVLRDVGENEEYGMLMSLVTERLRLRGGKKESLTTQHLVVRENGAWRIRVGFDTP